MAKIDDLLNKVDSKYTLVHLSASRAREINDYYHSLGDGMSLYVRPLVDCPSNKPLSIAFEEIAAGKIIVSRPSEARHHAEDLFDSFDGAPIAPVAPVAVPEAVEATEDAEVDAEAEVEETSPAEDVEAVGDEAPADTAGDPA